MLAEHFIQFILVRQGDHVQYVELKPDQKPQTVFRIDPAQPFEVYEYCNLHGLWKAAKG